MTHGMAERVRVTSVDAFGALIGSLHPSQAVALGSLRDGLPDKVEITTEKRLNGVARSDLIARTGASIRYCGPAFALLDHDSKGMPPAVAAELKRHGGFWPALLMVLPALKDTARVTRHSTGAGLSRADTGERLPGSDGVHVYVAEKDGAIASGFCRATTVPLAGLGWMMVATWGLAGAFDCRRMVGPNTWRSRRSLLPPLRRTKPPPGAPLKGGARHGGSVPAIAIERARFDELS
jgi:hypothetical protein